MAKSKPATKLFVIDTNVLLHDPYSLFKFQEHHIFIPFVTLEELDNHKTGTQDINRNARQVSRLIEEIVSQKGVGSFKEGYPLAKFNGRKATGKLFLQENMPENLSFDNKGKVHGKNDNEILAVMMDLRALHESTLQVILVSKDINLRIKARGLQFTAEDYKNDHTVEDAELLRKGYAVLPDADKILESVIPEKHSAGNKAGASLLFDLPRKFPLLRNEMAILQDKQYVVSSMDDGMVRLSPLVNHASDKNAVWGITARNAGQNFALNLLLNPEVDFITLLGPAGTGKTLLTLAAGLKQVIEEKLYDEIIFTRATVPMGEEIGFLPGTEEEKMLPWLGALEDNIDVLIDTSKESDTWAQATTRDLVRSRVKVKSISFMRGRTFHRKFFIVDEAQNLTPKQIKALITRAGPGTKVICMGNLSQIDTPYLTESSSGLTFAVDRFKGWEHFGHVILESGERSRLATFANDNL